MKILITSGGTKVKIDRVRHIGNMSSGTFGAKIALEALKAGHEVNFLMAKGSKHPLLPDFRDKVYGDLEFMSICEEYAKLQRKYSNNLWIETYEDFYDYKNKTEAHCKGANLFGKPDAIVLAAAVSDYGVENPVDGKIRSKDSEMSIKLCILPKIISSVRNLAPEAFIVGFKLLVDSTDEELVNNAKDSILKNNVDLVVANDLRDIKNNNHRLHIVNNNGVEVFEASENPEDHEYLARKVVERIKK